MFLVSSKYHHETGEHKKQHVMGHRRCKFILCEIWHSWSCKIVGYVSVKTIMSRIKEDGLKQKKTA